VLHALRITHAQAWRKYHDKKTSRGFSPLYHCRSVKSYGSVFGPDGNVEAPAHFGEREAQVFDFDNTTAGSVFRFVVRRTSLSDGYAAYHAFPRDSEGVPFAPAPEPGVAVVLLAGGLAVLRRRPRAAGRKAEGAKR
jgi:hypothetical protein